VVSDREVDEVRAIVGKGNAGQARKVGELVYADGILLGRVLRFRERVGEDLGVQSPASVAFTLQLVDVKRGDIIWVAEYQETQQALSDNLFSIGDFTRRGAKWLKAEELARDGVQQAIQQLNQLLYPSR
jgi:curli biogenesis system outer membrane secretion channel CsgG